MYILTGLGSEYDVIVTIATSRVKTFTMREIYSLFLTHEARILRNNSLSTNNLSVNVANENTGRYKRNLGNYGRGQGSFDGGNRGRYLSKRGQGSSKSNLQCEICFKVVHSAIVGIMIVKQTYIYDVLGLGKSENNT